MRNKELKKKKKLAEVKWFTKDIIELIPANICWSSRRLGDKQNVY